MPTDEPEAPVSARLRVCLGGCERLFESLGPANRICRRCSSRRPTLSREERIGGRRSPFHADDLPSEL